MYLGKIDIDALKLLKDIQKQNNNFIFDDRLFVEYGYDFKNKNCVLYGAFNYYEMNNDEDNIRWGNKSRVLRFKNLCNSIGIPFFNIRLKISKNDLFYVVYLNDCNEKALNLLLEYKEVSSSQGKKLIYLSNNKSLGLYPNDWHLFIIYLRTINKQCFSRFEEIRRNKFKFDTIRDDMSLIEYMSEFHKQLGEGYYLSDIDAIIYSSKKCNLGSNVTFLEFKSMSKYCSSSYIKKGLYQILQQYINPYQLNMYKELIEKSYKKFNINFLDIFYLKKEEYYYFISPYNAHIKYDNYKSQEDFIECVLSKITKTELENIINNDAIFKVKMNTFEKLLDYRKVDLHKIKNLFLENRFSKEEFSKLLLSCIESK